MDKLKVPYNIDSDYSEGFIDFYGRQPKWIIRYGLFVIIFVLFFFILLGFVIKYPDTIISRITITSENPTTFIKPEINGVIDSVLVSDLEKVKKDEIILILENNAEFSDYLFLKKNLQNNKFGLLLNDEITVGDIQNAFNDFIFQIQKNKIKNSLKQNEQREQKLKSSLKQKMNLIDNQLAKLDFLKAEVILEKNSIERYRGLYEKGLISKQELENHEKVYLNKKQLLEDSKAVISSSRMDVLDIEKSITVNKIEDLELDLIQRENIVNAKLLLMKSIAEWERKYLLKSPIDGIISFHNFLITENRNINLEQEIFSVTPKEHGRLFGIVELPLLGSGKVKKGQTVNIYLDNYPNEQFGVVKGRIAQISPTANNKSYLTKVILPNGLKTSYNFQINYSPNLTGRAEILTEEMSLIRRIFNDFVELFGSDRKFNRY